MKELALELKKNGEALKELLDDILKECDYNLDQYINGKTLSLPETIDESFVDAVRKMLEQSVEVVKAEQDQEAFWEQWKEIKGYENNQKFFHWLKRYVEVKIRPYQDTIFLRDMEEEQIFSMIEYCFENLILKDVGKEAVEKTDWNLKEMTVLRKMLFTFLEMVFTDNFAGEKAYSCMQRMFYMNENIYAKIWDLTKVHKEELWKIMIMRRYRKLENKLDRILDMIED